MNRVISRAKILIAMIVVFCVGTGLFCFEYILKSEQWVHSAGSPHVYSGEHIGCGVITDRDGVLLVDMTQGRVYTNDVLLRSSVIHWVGDKEGNISTPALTYYADQILGYDRFNGTYAYGGTGGKVTLTMSAQVQKAALEALGEYKGTIAVYNYKTGEILCAVSTPTFDPYDPPVISEENSVAYDGVYLNRLIQATYTPGSIFKIVTLAAALETIPDIHERTFLCEGIKQYGVDRVTCEQSHGKLSLQEAFAKSCNCAFAQIADELGGQTLQKYACQLGVSESLSFDGISTASGSVSAENEAPVLVAWSAIGQHKDLINPCSYMTLLGSIASGGSGALPHYVSKITVGMKTTYKAQSAFGEQIMSEQTANTIAAYLRNNVENYYGDDAFLGLTVCAKSGTAEVGGDKKPNAMFTGFVADEKYPLAFIVAVEDGGYGRAVCTPIISKVLAQCKIVLDGQVG